MRQPLLAFTATLDAHSGPLGENPTGTAFLSARSNVVGGPVTCLTVSGNRAVIGGESFTTFGPGYLFEVETNAATGTPDGAGFSGSLGEVPTTCPADLDLPLAPAVSDDLIVHDAQPPPLPTLIRDCLNGRWRDFGFNSFGACVKFVALTRLCEALERHGHQPPFCPPTPPRRA